MGTQARSALAAPAPPAQPNQSLADGLACLQALAVSGQSVGGRELARRLGRNPMRVNRLLKTLAFLGLARQTPDRRYTVGPGMHVLSVQSLFASGLLRRAFKPVQSLPWQRHAVALGVLWRDQVCYLFHAAPGQPLTSALGGHPLYPATQSSIGMVLLAHQSNAQLRDLFGDRPIPGYPGGLPSLRRELKRIREGGHAYVVQRQTPYTASVAVPIGAPPYGGLALSQNITPQKAKRWLPALRDAADRIDADE
jgi:DNA-binding IclR family transcriptional regulator